MNKINVKLFTLFLFLSFQLSGQEIPTEPNIFDYGKMWTFEDAPFDYWKGEYGFEATEEWVEKSRMSALRFASWCSASFVSPNGLIMTNHHCSNGEMPKIMKAGEDFNKNGFYAASMEEERRVDDLFVEQLVQIADITKEVQDMTSKASNDSEVATLREEAYNAVKAKYGAMPGWENLRLQTIMYYSCLLYTSDAADE